MRKIMMLAAANIRKNKSQAGSLLLFVLIAVLFLNAGLVMLLNFDKFFDIRAEQRHTPHLTVLQKSEYTKEEQLDWLKRYPGVNEAEKLAVLADYGEYFMHGSKNVAAVIFQNANDRSSMNPFRLVGESLPLENNGIYVPYIMKVAGDYRLGDDYRLNFDGQELHFTIAGFTEEITFGALMSDLYRFYVPDKAFAAMSARFPDSQSYLQTARMEKSSLGTQAQLDYEKAFYHTEEMKNVSSPFVFALSYNAAKEARSTVSITALLITAFALIMLIVSLIVIHFGIVNNIDEGMTNIGALKALGYKSSQIMLSIVLQFSSIALAGGLIGIAASQLLLPILAAIMESQSALIWKPGLDAGLAFKSLLFILFLVLAVSLWAVKRIFKLPPLIALRGGLHTHSFKRNTLLLEKTQGPLPLILAMKQLMQSKKQAVMVIVVIAAMSFASVAGMSVYYNIGVKPDVFLSMIAGENADAAFVLKDRSLTDEVVRKLQQRPEVRKAFGYQHIPLVAENIDVSGFITKDFGQREVNMLFEGRYPKHDNEVAVGYTFAAAAGKKIGDAVMVNAGGQEKEFIITGFIQSMSSGGLNMMMTYDGILTIKPDFTFDQICVYLAAGTDTTAFLQSVKAAEGNIFSYAVNTKELIRTQFSQIGDIFAVVAAGMLAVTMLVVLLILYMVIKTMILRKKRELGLQKALGFTTFQLMNQTAFHYTPIILIGTILGSSGGYFGLNPILSLFMRGAGIVKTNLPAPAAWTIITCIVLTGLAYLVSMLISWRIRKISPYSLISE
ncbi:ABC transporter permease [Paenibacillus sp. NPDC058174]|uniref:ABC transporter permease n=1 Tax=Paenibacillus sp. NPDC058174 TaxID=3346366 RepID=UPI0036DE90A3